METGSKRDYKNFDFFLSTSVFALVIMGIIAISSATHIDTSDNHQIFNSQIIWFVLGIAVMLTVAFIDYHFIGQFYIFAYLGVIALLGAVLLVGQTKLGATRWLAIGLVGLQPSEFMKIVLIFSLAKVIDKKKEKINNIFVLIFVLIIGFIPVILTLKQNSLSVSLTLVFIIAIVLFAGDLDFRYILAALIVISIGSYVVITDLSKEEPQILPKVLQGYQWDRIDAMRNPEQNKDDSYWQTKYSIDAIASGELRGKGLYKGPINKLDYVYSSYNDFVITVIGEEFGFTGCITILTLMFIIIFRCIWVAKKSVDLFGRIICAGVAGMFLFQTFVNVGVATGILPATGMTLPFVSYGGSSLLTNMIAIGFVLNIGMTKPKPFFEGA